MIIRRLAHLFGPGFSRTIIYMLQSTEYQTAPYARWFWRVDDFTKVMYRRTLVTTKASKLLLLALRVGILTQLVSGIIFAALALENRSLMDGLIAFVLITLAPIIWAHIIVFPLIVGRWLIVKPSQTRKIKNSAKIFERHSGVRIAIAGSYGKTTMKEMLLTVLSEGKKVAATEANKNVPISHAEFAHKLSGDEEVLIIEYGEGAPGDVARFAKVTKPTMGIITGLAPAHLDKYKTLHKAGEDIFSLAQYLGSKNIFVNAESEAVKPFLKHSFSLYSSHEAASWKISSSKVSIEGLSFSMSRGGKKINVKAAILGHHQIGPIALACALAYNLGLNITQIEAGTAKIAPFEHRMQPYRLGAAWVIDDSYNGNIDGMEAGLKLLNELPAKRKIYVTPGLVDQGPENQKVHHKLGALIARSGVDEVVLIKNSVTGFIVTGLGKKSFKGKLKIEDDPLAFYSNLDQFVAAGDLVLMQNDWTDNYN